MSGIRSILYLDDLRIPTSPDVHLVRNYTEFVDYLMRHPMPDLISFDHDLAREHYPTGPNRAGQQPPYANYREQTGLQCAEFVIDNKLELKRWAVHSSNVQGSINIERALRRYCRRGETRDFQIPFTVTDPDAEVVVLEPAPATTRRRQYSSTSLLQFEEELPLESWERGLARTLVGGR